LNKPGLTLIELLVSASLFLIISFSFVYVSKTAASSLKTASHLSQAVYTLQTKMEEVKRRDFTKLLSLNGTTFAKEKGKILVAPLLDDLLKIKIEYQWHAKKPPIQYETLRSKH